MDRVGAGLTLLRVAVALMMLVHGAARAALGIVDDFGVVLDRWGFPMGPALAWAITVTEIVGGALLAAGWLVRPLALWFALQLAAGIYLIHGRVGWFVVGAGRNGMEYSVLLLACLAVVALADDAAFRLGGASMSRVGRAAASLLAILFLAAPAPSAAASVACGGARPALDAVATAEGLVIAPDGTFYFSQPFVGPNQNYLARYRPPFDRAP